MRDRTHSEHVKTIGRINNNSSRSVWFGEVGPMIDAQIIMANAFYERLAKTQDGIEKNKIA